LGYDGDSPLTILASAAAKALYTALESPVGIIIRTYHQAETLTTPSFRAKQILYRFRKELGDVELLKIQIRFSPTEPDTELWLIKTEIEGEEI